MSQVVEPESPGRLNRRGFLLGAASTVGGALVVGCAAPDRESQVQSFPFIPEQSLPGQDLWFATCCGYAPGGNSIVVRTVDGRAKKVEGNPSFPVNQGGAHVRDQAAVQNLYHPDRLRQPLRRTGLRGSGEFEPIGWDQARELILERLRGASGSFAMITGPLSGTRALAIQSLTQGLGGVHYVFEPMESSALRQAVKLVFGFDQLPHLDIANARSVLSFGADLLGTFLSPVQYEHAYGQMRDSTEHERGILIQVEPHMSLTGANADRWVPVNPGQEGALALSIAQVIVAEGLAGNPLWFEIVNSVGGLPALNEYAPDKVSTRVGVPVQIIQAIAREFASHQPGIAIPGATAVGHTNGLDSAAAVLLLNQIVGSVGVAGGIQANPAAPAGLPASPAPNSFAEWVGAAENFRSAERPSVVFVYDTDPSYALPVAIKFDEALGEVPFVIGMATFLNDTVGLADLVLPAAHPLEEWGDFVPNPLPGHGVVGFQQPVVRHWTDARSFGDLALELATELGFAVPAPTMQTAVQASAQTLFGVGDQAFGDTWIDLLRRGGREFPETTIPVPAVQPDWHIGLLAEPQFAGGPVEFPFHLIPFESVSLGFGSEAEAPWLQAVSDPITTVAWQSWVELNPNTAASLRLKSGDVVSVETPHGSLRLSAYVSPVIPPEVVAIATGQGHKHGGRWNRDRGVNVLSVLAPLADAGSGGLAWAATRARIVRTGEYERLPTIEILENSRNDVEDPPVQVTRE